MHKFLFYNKIIIFLYMFRALLRSSSGGQNCIIQHLVSSHSVGGRSVYRNSCFIIRFLYSSTCFEHYCAHHQEVKIVLYSIWYHTCRWPSGALVERGLLSQPVHRMTTYSMWRYQMLYNTILTSCWWAQQCWKHVEAYNKLITKQEFMHSVG